MKITLIAALAQNNVIGYQDGMPWHMPADLKHFQQATLHKPIIMGRKSYDSLGKALPNRRNIVITRNTDLKLNDAEVVNSLQLGLALISDVPEVMIGGGAMIYQQALDIATDMNLTFIDAKLPGDTFFPEWEPSQWQEVSRESHLADDRNPYNYDFVYFKKIK